MSNPSLSLRHRHGRRVGRLRLSRHGKSDNQTARVSLRLAPAGIRSGLPSGGDLFLLRLPPLGLATDVFHRRITRPAWAFRPLPGQRIGGVAEDSPLHLDPSVPPICPPPETFP